MPAATEDRDAGPRNRNPIAPAPKPMPGYFLELDLTDRRVLVVGLGAVGRRKAAGLIACGARVVGVDPAPPADLPPEIDLRAEPYRPDHLLGVALAFAAATPEVNRRVVVDAKSAGIWVNSASEPEEGDFRVPAAWRSGAVGLAVSTSGASPALASHLRDRAAGGIGPGAPVLAEALAALRAEVLAGEPDPLRRRRLLADLDVPHWLARAESEGADRLLAELRAWARRRADRSD